MISAGSSLVLLLATSLVAVASSRSIDLEELMPRRTDQTQMWWAQGFPSHTPDASWLRVIQTGHYALALETETLRIAHFGAVPDIATDLRSLPAASLTLLISVDGKTYRATAGGKWSRWTGPRLIESGRFLQRADITDLVFTAADGERLEAEARFETAAWPDRLALILFARPKPNAPARAWKNAMMEIRLATAKGELTRAWKLPDGQMWTDWQSVALPLDPAAFQEVEDAALVRVHASEIPGGVPRLATFDPALGWHRVNLDGVEPIVPPGEGDRRNDALERVKLTLANPTGREQVARLMFEKTAGGIRQRIGAPITGITAVLRDADGHPTGLPIQLSKNWHNQPEGGVYSGQWFHGISQVRLPAGSAVELELTLAYGHWGGVAAASHAQLCLIGWGSNQLWEQSALGAWGESICYDPDQIQANATITDVRPLMVRSMKTDVRWGWTVNVGGGDFFRLIDPAGKRIAHTDVRTTHHRVGPCLTEVTYAARSGEGLAHPATVSLARSDDLVRGTYRLRLDVLKRTDFARFVIFQIGADTYSYTAERKIAFGDETGLRTERDAQWGGNRSRGEPLEATGRIPWVSLHEAVPPKADETGAWANRGLVIRAWKARLGGREASPWIAERGLTLHRRDTSTLDLVPPPDVTRLEPGDFVEATIEHIVMPQFARDYYGPNTALRAALTANENTWRMIHREAVGNDRRVGIKTGRLLRTHPAIAVEAVEGEAAFALTGGLGFVPVTFSGLSSPRGHRLFVDERPVEQSVHGADFWQTDFDPATRTWSRTYNLPITDTQAHIVRFARELHVRPAPPVLKP